MKLVKAIVRPNKVDEVRDALEKMNVGGMTVTEVRGHGRQKGHTAIYRGKEYDVTLLPKICIDVVVTEQRRGGCHPGHHPRGADRRDRRRPGVRAARRAELQHPHRRRTPGRRAEAELGHRQRQEVPAPPSNAVIIPIQESMHMSTRRLVRRNRHRWHHVASRTRSPYSCWEFRRSAARQAPPPTINQADTAWMLISTALVLLMTPALAFFYGGLVRSKNALEHDDDELHLARVRRRAVGDVRLLAGLLRPATTGSATPRVLPARRRPRAAGHDPARALHGLSRARSRSSPRR